MTTEDVSFFSGPGLRLAAQLYLPDPANDRGAGVVFYLGFGGGAKEGTPVGLSTRLAAHGYTVLSFDYRGFGGSEGVRGRLVPNEQVEATTHALEFLAARPGIDPNRIALYGTSFGGGIALLAAQRSRPRIDGHSAGGLGRRLAAQPVPLARVPKDRATRAQRNRTKDLVR